MHLVMGEEWKVGAAAASGQGLVLSVREGARAGVGWKEIERLFDARKNGSQTRAVVRVPSQFNP